MQIFRRVFPLAAATALLAGGLGSIVPATQANAGTSIFDQTEQDQSAYVAVASPIDGGSKHQLLVIEQKSNARQCWDEAGSSPTIIDPLLLQFNFSGICGRSTDGNGYSIRVEGNQDLALDYSLAVVRRAGDLVLIGRPQSRSNPEIEIGRAFGDSNGFAKINLNPGWRFTKRSYEGKTLGHVYLSNDQSLESIVGQAPVTPPVSAPAPVPTPTPEPAPVPVEPAPVPPAPEPAPPAQVSFLDVASDIYATEIEQAASLGFISGFADGTFKPAEPLTREQVVSIVVESLLALPDVNMDPIGDAQGSPFPDVEQGRWSANKIAYARDRQIVAGYKEDGTFRPTQPVSRAELIAVMRRAAEYARTQRGLDAQLSGTEPVQQFADLGGHWSEQLVTQMSAYCKVASPINEAGSSFYPNTPAQRNYAAAATLRMWNCVKNAGS